MIVRRISSNELYHHGIKGQKWGVRRYQNYDGTSKIYKKIRRHEKAIERANKHSKGLDNKVNKAIAYSTMGISGGMMGLRAAGTKMAKSAVPLSRNKIAAGLILGSAIGALASIPYTKAVMKLGKRNDKMIEKYHNRKINELKNIVSVDGSKVSTPKRKTVTVTTKDGDTFKVINADEKSIKKYEKDPRIKSVK